MATKEGAPKTPEAVVICLYPDVCKAPEDPVPFQIVAIHGDAVEFSKDIKFTGVPAMNMNSRIPTVQGDEAGTGGGVSSGVNMAWCRPVDDAAKKVLLNGSPGLRHETRWLMNCAGPDGANNTEGLTAYLTGAPVAAVDANGNIIGDTMVPANLTEAEQSWFKRAVEEVARLNKDYKLVNRGVALLQMGGGAAGMAIGAVAMIAPTGVTQILGVAGTAYSADLFYTGSQNWNSGELNDTAYVSGVKQAATWAGATPGQAQWISFGADLGGAVLTGGVPAAGKAVLSGADNVVTAGADNAVTAGADNVVTAGADNVVTAGADNVVTAGADNAVTAGADNAVTAGADNVVTAGADNAVTAGADNAVTAGAGQGAAAPSAKAAAVTVPKAQSAEIKDGFLIHKGKQYALTDKGIAELGRGLRLPSWATDTSSLQGKRVLDAGAGGGAFVRDLKAAGVDAYGFDITPSSFLESGVSANDHFLAASIEKLPFANGSFDVAYSNWSVFYYYPKEIITQALQQLSDVVKVGGEIRLIGVDPKVLSHLADVPTLRIAAPFVEDHGTITGLLLERVP